MKLNSQINIIKNIEHMDRQLKRLVERLLSEYEARPLNENIFKKLNAVYGP